MAQARFLEGPIAPFSSELQAQLPVRSGASDGGGEACPVPARAESWVCRWRDEAPGRGGALARFRAWFQTKTERPHPFLGSDRLPQLVERILNGPPSTQNHPKDSAERIRNDVRDARTSGGDEHLENLDRDTCQTTQDDGGDRGPTLASVPSEKSVEKKA